MAVLRNLNSYLCCFSCRGDHPDHESPDSTQGAILVVEQFNSNPVVAADFQTPAADSQMSQSEPVLPSIHQTPASPSPQPPGSHTIPQRDGKESRKVLRMLKEHSALAALANSWDREWITRCHQDTREETLNDLHNWSQSKDLWRDLRFLMLTAPAGHGKTTLMQTFADQLLGHGDDGGHLAILTFFFMISNPQQDHAQRLVATLAHQVAEQSPTIRPYIVETIANEEGIFLKALKYQVQRLLIQPIRDAAHALSLSLGEVVVVVDGINECGPSRTRSYSVGNNPTSEDSQSFVMELLHSLASSGSFRVLISSRPGHPINEALAQKWDDTHHLPLEKWHEPVDIDDDHQADGALLDPPQTHESPDDLRSDSYASAIDVLELIPSTEISLFGAPLCFPIAMGAHADIYLADRTIKASKERVVVKVERGRHLELRTPENKEAYTNRVRRKYAKWVAMDHKNVLRVEGLVEHDELPSAGLVYVWKRYGDLASFMVKNEEAFDRLLMACGVSCGLVYLHSRDVAQGHLTTADILVDRDIETGCFFPLITDSGDWPDLGDEYTTQTGHGLTLVLPPEILGLEEGENSSAVKTPAGDVYSLSLVVLHIISGKEPFTQERLPRHVKAWKIADQDNPLRPARERYPVLDIAYEFCWEIMQDCWKVDPLERISSDEAHKRLCEGSGISQHADR